MGVRRDDVITGMPKPEIAHRGCCTGRQLKCGSVTPGPRQLAMDAGSTVGAGNTFALGLSGAPAPSC
jgi:hypothetical protein